MCLLGQQAAVFIQHRLDIGFLAAPPHPSGEVNLEVIEADVRIVMSPRKAQPNVFAARNALGRYILRGFLPACESITTI